MTALFTSLDPSDQTASFDFGYAYQPIVDTEARKIVSYEALVRGVHGEPAAQVFSRVAAEDMYRFDAASRVAAIKQAS